ncbi:hypothetical protein EVAR_8540_1 [Eumeta japonica]|uniref:Uncharacterized protein n=1 Tax=Eumeta variegata TaxID=151549 RepID=A0A4C1TXF2_EUMVA|nr:hypothetical protein EVAR_8540_1 [Eumeta japonica]
MTPSHRLARLDGKIDNCAVTANDMTLSYDVGPPARHRSLLPACAWSVQYNARNFSAPKCRRMMYCAGITLPDSSFFSPAFLFSATATLSRLTSQRQSFVRCTVHLTPSALVQLGAACDRVVVSAWLLLKAGTLSFKHNAPATRPQSPFHLSFNNDALFSWHKAKLAANDPKQGLIKLILSRAARGGESAGQFGRARRQDDGLKLDRRQFLRYAVRHPRRPVSKGHSEGVKKHLSPRAPSKIRIITKPITYNTKALSHHIPALPTPKLLKSNNGRRVFVYFHFLFAHPISE